MNNYRQIEVVTSNGPGVVLFNTQDNKLYSNDLKHQLGLKNLGNEFKVYLGDTHIASLSQNGLNALISIKEQIQNSNNQIVTGNQGMGNLGAPMSAGNGGIAPSGGYEVASGMGTNGGFSQGSNAPVDNGGFGSGQSNANQGISQEEIQSIKDSLFNELVFAPGNEFPLLPYKGTVSLETTSGGMKVYTLETTVDDRGSQVNFDTHKEFYSTPETSNDKHHIYLKGIEPDIIEEYSFTAALQNIANDVITEKPKRLGVYDVLTLKRVFHNGCLNEDENKYREMTGTLHGFHQNYKRVMEDTSNRDVIRTYTSIDKFLSKQFNRWLKLHTVSGIKINSVGNSFDKLLLSVNNSKSPQHKAHLTKILSGFDRHLESVNNTYYNDFDEPIKKGFIAVPYMERVIAISDVRLAKYLANLKDKDVLDKSKTPGLFYAVEGEHDDLINVLVSLEQQNAVTPDIKIYNVVDDLCFRFYKINPRKYMIQVIDTEV